MSLPLDPELAEKAARNDDIDPDPHRQQGGREDCPSRRHSPQSIAHNHPYRYERESAASHASSLENERHGKDTEDVWTVWKILIFLTLPTILLSLLLSIFTAISLLVLVLLSPLALTNLYNPFISALEFVITTTRSRMRRPLFPPSNISSLNPSSRLSRWTKSLLGGLLCIPVALAAGLVMVLWLYAGILGEWGDLEWKSFGALKNWWGAWLR